MAGCICMSCMINIHITHNAVGAYATYASRWVSCVGLVYNLRTLSCCHACLRGYALNVRDSATCWTFLALPRNHLHTPAFLAAYNATCLVPLPILFSCAPLRMHQPPILLLYAYLPAATLTRLALNTLAVILTVLLPSRHTYCRFAHAILPTDGSPPLPLPFADADTACLTALPTCLPQFIRASVARFTSACCHCLRLQVANHHTGRARSEHCLPAFCACLYHGFYHHFFFFFFFLGLVRSSHRYAHCTLLLPPAGDGGERLLRISAALHLPRFGLPTCRHCVLVHAHTCHRHYPHRPNNAPASHHSRPAVPHGRRLRAHHRTLPHLAYLPSCRLCPVYVFRVFCCVLPDMPSVSPVYTMITVPYIAYTTCAFRLALHLKRHLLPVTAGRVASIAHTVYRTTPSVTACLGRTTRLLYCAPFSAHYGLCRTLFGSCRPFCQSKQTPTPFALFLT